MFRHTYGGSGEDDARLSVEMEKRNVFTDGEENERCVDKKVGWGVGRDSVLI